jgi:hypothetical protein
MKTFFVRLSEVNHVNMYFVNWLHISMARVHSDRSCTIYSCHCDSKIWKIEKVKKSFLCLIWVYITRSIPAMQCFAASLVFNECNLRTNYEAMIWHSSLVSTIGVTFFSQIQEKCLPVNPSYISPGCSLPTVSPTCSLPISRLYSINQLTVSIKRDRVGSLTRWHVVWNYISNTLFIQELITMLTNHKIIIIKWQCALAGVPYFIILLCSKARQFTCQGEVLPLNGLNKYFIIKHFSVPARRLL